MSTAVVCFLAIEPRLQLLDRGAGQDQGLVAHDVVDIGADRGDQVDALEVRRGAGEADVQRIAVHHQSGLAESQLAELLRSSRVLPSLRSRLSTTTSWPLIAFDDSAILRPSARTFLLRLDEKIRARGPWALPPPTKIGA